MSAAEKQLATVEAMPLAKTRPDPTRAFEPGSIEEAVYLAKVLVASKLLPKSITTPEAAFAVIACGRELGLTAMQSLRTIHIIEGKPTLSADLVAALVKSRGDICQFFRLVDSTAEVATYETQRRGEPGPTRMSFTWQDAQRAGVTGKDNWKRYPAAMLRARCITALARAVYPDLAMGVYDPDELTPEPEPVRPPRVVVESTQAELQRPVNGTAAFALWEDLCAKLDACETVAAVNALAVTINNAHKAGKLSDVNLAALKSAVGNKRKLLAEEPPTAPPSNGIYDHERQPGEDDQ